MYFSAARVLRNFGPGWMLALVLAACAAPGSAPLAVGDPAPDFRLRNVDGATVSLADFRDQRPVLLFFHMAVG
jgi:cytochrome oxidase Cu insertion factor (SCO1/SenC/PrrC family)